MIGSSRPLEILRLGLRPYGEVWGIQKNLQNALIAGSGVDTLILCRHHPVITLGRSAKRSNVLASGEDLARAGVEAIEVERGGDVTYHGPGQIVGYPIVNLNFLKRDVGWFMRSLEEVVILALRRYDIEGLRIEGKTGVWVRAPGREPRKIASIGVRISRWCTLHGFALNVHDDAAGFSLINPCGFRASDMTSIAEFTAPAAAERAPRQIPLVETEDLLVQYFLEVFGFSSL